ncbi:Uncharacterised protein [Klebsiella oxytoca]|nr:Uncharacterised protein [Klebsiella oxytoca]
MLTRIHCLVTHRLNIGPERVLVYFSESDVVGQYVFGKPGFADGITAQRLPFIAVPSRIDDHAVRVYLWLLSARCIVVKAGNNQIPGQDRFRHAIFLYPRRGKGLHLIKRHRHRAVMRVNQALIATQHRQHRDTFRGRKG